MATRNTAAKRRRAPGTTTAAICGLAIAPTLLIPSQSAVAQPSEVRVSEASGAARAPELVEQAKTAFSAGQAHEALRGFRDAWSLTKTPEIAANLAIVEAGFGHHRDAAEHFRFALSHLPAGATVEQKQAVAAGLDAEKRYVLTLVMRGAPVGATISIDGTLIGSSPVDDVYVEPGRHDIRAQASGYQGSSRSIDGAAGTTLDVQLSLVGVGERSKVPTSAPSRPPTLRDPVSPRVAPIAIGAGIMVVGATLGTIFLLKGRSAENAASNARRALPVGDNACGTGTPDGPQCETLHDANLAVDRDRNIGAAGLVAGSAAAVGTLVYWLWPRARHVERTSAGAVVAPGYAFAEARWTW